MTFQTNADTLKYVKWEAFFDDAFISAKADERYSLPGDGYEFAHVAWPLIEFSSMPVSRTITQLWRREIIHPQYISSIYAAMVEPLWESIFSKVSRVMILEFAAAQSTGLLNTQNGSDSYALYAECLQDTDFSGPLLKRNPILCELISVICQNWRVASLEFLEHLQTDWDHLKEQFSCEPGDKVTAIRSSLGDTHRYGRSVKIIEFNSGQKLVYKPRNLAAEKHFERFVSWFNAAANQEMLRSVDVLNRTSRGWCEHIDHLPVSDADELASYFRRLGTLMAVARVLGLTDLHSENLIAHGGWPVIIDLETLFHPLAGDLRPDDAQPPASIALRMVHDTSVAATGLLPVRRVLSREHDNAINLAGMSDTAGQETPFTVPMWHNAGSDEMRLVEDHQKLVGNANVPVLHGQRISPEPYLEQVLDGFRKAYAILMENRETLLSETGPLATFNDDHIRIVIRATQTYLFLLGDGSHPDLLESKEKKQGWFDDALNEPNQSHILTTLRQSEMAALWRNDVPYFETTVNGENIMTCDGRMVENLLPRTGMETARHIIADLGPEDLRRQCWLIEIALTKADHTTAQPDLPANKHAFKKQSQPGIHEMALAIVRRAARDICEHAIVKDEHASWITVQEGNGGALSAQLAGLDLYSGLPGIALFLSQAGRILNDVHVQTIGKAATRELLSALSCQQNTKMPIGGFSGAGGLFFALCALADEQPELDCIAANRRLSSIIEDVGFSEASLELVDGLAGLLLGSLYIQSSGPLQIAICNEIINRLKEATENGQTVHQLFASTGMAHGVEGLQFALARLAQSDDHAMKALSAKGLCLLKGLAQVTSNREARCIHNAPIAWCNGLTGNLLVNHVCGQGDPEIIAEELIARLETQDYSDDSLCHGAMGALQALQQVVPSLPGRLTDKHHSLTETILRRVMSNDACCGTLNGVFSPGLMDGMSGIGIAALGIADQRQTSVIPLMAYNSMPNAMRRVSRL